MGQGRGSLARLYDRLGVRYLLVCVIVVWLFSLGMCAVIALLLTSLYLQMPAHQIAGTLVLGELGTIAGLGTALFHTSRRVTPPLQNWASGERTRANAAAAWEAATRATFTWPAVAGVACAIFTLPAQLLVLHYGPIPAWQIFLVFTPVVQFGIIATSILAYFCGEAFLRPIVAEISERLPPHFEPRGWTPRLRSRLLPTVLVVDLFASMLAGGLVSRASSPAEALVFSFLAGLGINLTFSLTWTLALAGSILGPVRNLSAAASSVKGGDLTTRVPVIGKDELTELSVGFNQMVEGLEERESLRETNVGLVDQLRASRARIVASWDEARRKVERDLHDGAQQHLVLLDLKLAMAERKAKQKEDTGSAIAKAREDLHQALSELRDLAHGIYPSVLSNDGLVPALEEAAARSTISAAIRSEGMARYPAEMEAAVYFCCLEALQNAGKYAGEGASAEVSIEEREGQLSFRVRDDGRGFDPASVNGSAGLQNMADRIGALGGQVSIDSTPGEGTTVSGSVPLSPVSAA